MEIKKRVGIYCRVSTKDQHSENQLNDLRRYCEARGWQVAGEFIDQGVSGSKDNRPQLSAIMELANKRRIDTLLVWKFDRFARSLTHLVNTLEDLRQRGVEFVSYSENIDTSTPSGKLVYQVIGAIAEFELSLIKERIHSGLRRAKANGVKLGRPEEFKDLSGARTMRQEGRSLREIASALSIGKSTVARLLSQNPSKKLETVS